MPGAVETPQTDLRIDALSKAFGRVAALKHVSLSTPRGGFLALLGPSGSGKTTLLRVLAGLERPDAGAVTFQGEDFLALPARRRRVGMVFQQYALFRHMTVAENVAFGLTVRPRPQRPSAAAIRRTIAELLALVRLEDLGKRYPAQLSGGQRQRVALARALAIEPQLLLLDEPFGALDAQVRRELRRWLREVHDRTGLTTVFVTHDQEEALGLADQVAILKAGELVQLGEPQALYEAPADAFVYEFLGPACRVEAQIVDGRVEVGDWRAAAPGASPGPAALYFRPGEAELTIGAGDGIAATIRGVRRLGAEARVDCAIGAVDAELHVAAAALPAGAAPGTEARVRPLRWTAYPATPTP